MIGRWVTNRAPDFVTVPKYRRKNKQKRKTRARFPTNESKEQTRRRRCWLVFLAHDEPLERVESGWRGVKRAHRVVFLGRVDSPATK